MAAWGSPYNTVLAQILSDDTAQNNREVTEIMAVKIRLRRMGAKKAPFYRIVVADSRYPRDGRFIEEIGYYDPTTEPSSVRIDAEKAKKWIANGAQPTETVRSIFKKNNVL